MHLRYSFHKLGPTPKLFCLSYLDSLNGFSIFVDDDSKLATFNITRPAGIVSKNPFAQRVCVQLVRWIV